MTHEQSKKFMAESESNGDSSPFVEGPMTKEMYLSFVELSKGKVGEAGSDDDDSKLGDFDYQESLLAKYAKPEFAARVKQSENGRITGGELDGLLLHGCWPKKLKKLRRNAGDKPVEEKAPP